MKFFVQAREDTGESFCPTELFNGETEETEEKPNDHEDEQKSDP